MKTSRILVSVDIEGVAGVWRPEQTQPGNGDYERARRWMTQEANAAIQGAFDGGAQSVLVNDSHGHFGNLLIDELDPRAEVIQGKPRLLGMMTGIEQDAQGVMMIGWHAQAKTQGVLAHTVNSFAFARVWLDSDELGEIGLYGALATELEVPVLMLSGCNLTALEAAKSLPDAKCAVVKWSDGARSGRSLSPAQSQERIRQLARQVTQHRITSDQNRPALARQEGTRILRVQCQTPALADVFTLWPSIQRESADTVSMACTSVQNAIRCLNALSAMSSVLR